jgi:hypothetical protein
MFRVDVPQRRSVETLPVELRNQEEFVKASPRKIPASRMVLTNNHND